MLQVFCEARTDTFHSHRSFLGPSGSVSGGKKEEESLWHQSQPLPKMCQSDYWDIPFKSAEVLRTGPQEKSHGSQCAAWLLGKANGGEAQEEVDRLLCTGLMAVLWTKREQDSKPYDSRDGDWEAGIVGYKSESSGARVGLFLLNNICLGFTPRIMNL